jgi:hypothetical protein
MSWRVTEFSADRALGREASFSVDVWWPGEPALVARLKQSERRSSASPPRG